MQYENKAKNINKTKISNRRGNENENKMIGNNIEHDTEHDGAKREPQPQKCGKANKEKE